MAATARLRETPALIAEIKAALAELEEAEDLIRQAGKSVFIGFSGGIMIEVPKDEGLEYIERRKRALKALLEKLERER